VYKAKKNYFAVGGASRSPKQQFKDSGLMNCVANLQPQFIVSQALPNIHLRGVLFLQILKTES